MTIPMWAPVAGIESRTSACCILLEPRLHDLLHECGREGLSCGEAECSFPREVGLQLLPERLHDRRARREEAAVVLERGVGHEESTMVLERRHLVADRFGRLGRGGLDGLPKLLQSGARILWKGRQVVLDAGWCGHAGLLP